jgi:hypothetical protein
LDAFPGDDVLSWVLEAKILPQNASEERQSTVPLQGPKVLCCECTASPADSCKYVSIYVATQADLLWNDISSARRPAAWSSEEFLTSKSQGLIQLLTRAHPLN